jgi:hypothetical protein
MSRPVAVQLTGVELDFNAEMVGDGLYRAGELSIGGTEIVIFHNTVDSTASWALNGEQFGVHPSWLKAFENKPVRVAIATI